MKRTIISLVTAGLVATAFPVLAVKHYGAKICSQASLSCYTVKRGDSWQRLWSNSRQRDVVMKLNRMNTRLQPGMTIAVPRNIHRLNKMDIAPMSTYYDTNGKKAVVVKLSKLAWGAYDERGRLLNWGPVSGGKSWCSDVGRGCKTIRGEFSVYREQGAGCVSGKYPLPNGGAPMPYCMHFKGGYAMHGSDTVPGYHDSHGCVRMFPSDAKWLNQNFVTVPGTKVIVHGY